MKRAVLLLALAIALPRVAAAHPPDRTQIRETVRLQGHRSAEAEAPAGRMPLFAQGADHPFAAIDRRAFSVNTDEDANVADAYTLQGPREALFRFTSARAEQIATILAEHHPGSKDLFVLAGGLCAPK